MTKKDTPELTAEDVLGRGYNYEQDEDEDEDDDQLADRGDGAADLDDEDVEEVEEVEEVVEEVVEEEAEEEAEVVEEEEEVAEVVEEDPAPVKKDSNSMIPRARLNQEIQRRKALEQQIANLESRQPAAQAPVEAKKAEVDRAQIALALEKVLDGDVENATEALAAVLTAMGGASQAAAQYSPDQIAQGVKQELESRDLAAAAVELIAGNAFLDDTNDDHFDADAASDVVELRDSYIRRGVVPAEALRQAVARISKAYGYEEPAKAAAAKPAVPKLKPADVAKKVASAAAAPARIPKTAQPGNRERVSIIDIPEDEFDKMSSDAMRRARGDIV